MATKTLKRKPLETVSDEDYAGIRELAERSQKLLCYHALKRTCEQRRTTDDLVRAMSDLDIHPFDEKSVEKYKKKQAFRARRKDAQTVACAVTLGVLVACLATLVVSLLVWPVWACLAVGSSICGIVALGAFLTGVACVGTIIFMEEQLNFSILDVEWKMSELKYYDHPVPEFALETACNLKEKCPGAEFFVDWMDSRRVFLNDPFLVVGDRTGKKYYIEVWNEPKFQKLPI